jgi:hypothetical protein
MTSKEKAFQLYFSFVRDVIVDKEKAKKCALIAVHELMHNIRFNLAYGYEKQLQYWNEVKEEINKL